MCFRKRKGIDDIQEMINKPKGIIDLIQRKI